jgi:hypothetical protein
MLEHNLDEASPAQPSELIRRLTNHSVTSYKAESDFIFVSLTKPFLIPEDMYHAWIAVDIEREMTNGVDMGTRSPCMLQNEVPGSWI